MQHLGILTIVARGLVLVRRLCVRPSPRQSRGIFLAMTFLTFDVFVDPSSATSDSKSPLGLNFFKNLNSDKKQTKGQAHS